MWMMSGEGWGRRWAGQTKSFWGMPSHCHATPCHASHAMPLPLPGIFEPGPIDGEFSADSLKAMCPNRMPKLDAFPDIYDLAVVLTGKDPNGPDIPQSREKLLPLTYPRAGWHADLDKKNRLIYLRIWKCANNLQCFGQKLQSLPTTSFVDDGRDGSQEKPALEAVRLGKNPLMFAIVREPLIRFVSGYNEVLYQRVDAKFGNTSSCYVPEYDSLDNASPQKFREFVRQYMVSMLEWGGKCFGIGGGYAHLWPQANILVFKELDPMDIHVIDIEDTETVPQELRRHFGLTHDQLPIDTIDPECGQHVTSGDPLGSYAAAKAAAAEPDDPIIDAVCLYIIYDYACFPDYYLPDSRCKRAYDRHRDALENILDKHRA